MPHVYLFPIDGLTIDRVWSVDTIDLLPPGSAMTLIEAERQARTARGDPAIPDWQRTIVDDRVREKFAACATARIEAPDVQMAYTRVSDILGVLRLFAAWRLPMANTELQSFGLAGELPWWRAEYVDLAVGAAFGWFWKGTAAAWTFTADDWNAFRDSSGFQYLLSAVAAESGVATALQRRALLGQRLLNRAILDQQADSKLVAVVVALEVLFGESGWHGKGYGIARRTAYLTCSIRTNTMCGRDRPSCLYLALDPSNGAPQELVNLVKNANAATGTWCDRYLETKYLYERRNCAMHDGISGLSLEQVRTLAWPIYSWLLPAFLDWCAAHPNDDLAALDSEISEAVATRPPAH